MVTYRKHTKHLIHNRCSDWKKNISFANRCIGECASTKEFHHNGSKVITFNERLPLLTKSALDYRATKIPVPHVTPGCSTPSGGALPTQGSYYPPHPPAPYSRQTKVTLDYRATKIPPRHPRAAQRRQEELCLLKVRITPPPPPRTHGWPRLHWTTGPPRSPPRHPRLLNAVRRTSAYSRFVLLPPPRPVLTADQGYTGLPGHQDPPPRRPRAAERRPEELCLLKVRITPPPAPYSRLTKVTLDYRPPRSPHVTLGLLNAVRRTSAYSRFVLLPPPRPVLTADQGYTGLPGHQDPPTSPSGCSTPSGGHLPTQGSYYPPPRPVLTADQGYTGLPDHQDPPTSPPGC